MKHGPTATATVHLRLTPKQKRNLERAAIRTNTTVSEFLRSSLQIALPHSTSPITLHRAALNAIARTKDMPKCNF